MAVCIFLISIDFVTLTTKVCGVQKKETVLCGSYYFSVLKIFDYVETHLNSECKLPSVERSCQLSRAFRYDCSLTSRSKHWSEFSIWTSITGTSFTRLHRWFFHLPPGLLFPSSPDPHQRATFRSLLRAAPVLHVRLQKRYVLKKNGRGIRSHYLKMILHSFWRYWGTCDKVIYSVINNIDRIFSNLIRTLFTVLEG